MQNPHLCPLIRYKSNKPKIKFKNNSRKIFSKIFSKKNINIKMKVALMKKKAPYIIKKTQMKINYYK